ncbi:hypothetical protein FSP39_023468, partial [Pinctada imbricata]
INEYICMLVDLKEEDVTVLNDGHGNEVRCVEYGGHFFNAKGIANGRIPDPKVMFPRLRDMPLRDDDLFLLAYPKAGTHWLSEILYMLRNGKAEYDVNKKEIAMYEFQTPESLNELPSPRNINSHVRLNLLPKQLEEKRHKIVFAQRNPKDTCVSYYFHNQMAVQYPGTFIQFMDMFMGDKIYHEPWAEYTLYWEEALKTFPKELVHIVYYEDLKEDSVAEIKRLALFLGVKCSDDFVKDVAKKCGFENLKEANLTKIGKKDQHMYRKGAVGDWKNWFTVAKNEDFDNFLKTKMSKTSFVYRYTI